MVNSSISERTALLFALLLITVSLAVGLSAYARDNPAQPHNASGAHIDPTLICDGKTDIGPALQSLANRITVGTPTVIELPAGNCRLASGVVFRDVSTILEGQGYEEGPGSGMGTWIVLDHPGFTPFTFVGIHARGAIVRNFGVREIQPNITPNWRPIDYDFVFRITDVLGEITFDNVLFAGVTRGISDLNSGRLNINSIYGQFYDVGIEIDDCYDIPRINYAHFWTYVTSDPTIVGYQQQTLDAIVMRRVDGIFLGDIFSLGSRSVLRFTSGKNGVTTKAYVSNLYADFTQYGIWIDGARTTIQVANATTQHNDFGRGAQPIPGALALFVDAPDTVIQISNWRSDLLETSAIKVNKEDNFLAINSLWVNNWNLKRAGDPAIYIADSGSGVPNRIEFATPPLLQNGNGAPSRNASNGIITFLLHTFD